MSGVLGGVFGLGGGPDADPFAEAAEKRRRRRANDDLADRLRKERATEREERDAKLAEEREEREKAAAERKAQDVCARRKSTADFRRLEAEHASAVEELGRRAAAVYRGASDEVLVREAEDHLDRVEAQLRRANAAVNYLRNFAA